MARSPLTLAAVAAAAVPGLEATHVGLLDEPDFDAAAITGADGRHWRIRVPRNQRAETDLGAELVALAALTPGARARLPFDVVEVAGQQRFGPTRAVVTTYPYGDRVRLADIPTAPDGLGAAIGRAIGAIHALPTAVVTEAGLRVSGPGEARRSAVSVLDRTVATGLLPAAVQARWEQAIDDADLWQFQPVVTGGGLDGDSFRAQGTDVVSVDGWKGLSIGDPAVDLKWVVQSERVADAVFAGYAAVAGTGDRRLRHRSALLSELDLGRWLLHGIEEQRTDIVDDAVELLTTLAERVHGDLSARIDAPTAPVLTLTEVEDLLDRAQQAV